jgi:glycosyltransferase involved in cell wall biosynthesis
MPTYNARDWVLDTIDSLIAQTWPHIELIVVDDASSDDTVALARRKLKAEFKAGWDVVALKANSGPSAARNIGLKQAAGAWVQFLDADDFLAPDKLALQMAVCAGAPGDVAAVYSPWRRCYDDDGKMEWAGPLVRPDMEGRSPLMALVGDERPLLNAGLARREGLLQIGGFDETLRFWECEELTVRLAKAGRLVPVGADEPLYLWRDYRDRDYIGAEGARYHFAPVALSWIEQMVKAAGHRTFDEMALSERDRADIRRLITFWGRLLYTENLGDFRRFRAMAQQFDPAIGPSYPAYASALSRYTGYETAEAVARLGRAPGRILSKFLKR